MTTKSPKIIRKKLNKKYGRRFISLKELCTELDQKPHIVNMRRPIEIYSIGHQIEQRWFFDTKEASRLIASGFKIEIINETTKRKNINIKRRNN